MTSKRAPLSLLVSGFLPSDDIFLKDLCRCEEILLRPWLDETARHPERSQRASLNFLYFWYKELYGALRDTYNASSLCLLMNLD